MASIRVLLFASYADALGTSRLELEVDESATVADVLAELRGRDPGRRLPPAPLVAVNESYARPDSPVHAGDEVAVIPPVAGG